MMTAHDRAQYDALFDRETGLPTFALLLDRTHVAVIRARRARSAVAVFVLDDLRNLDKRPPDMPRIAKCLRARLRPDDTLARTGLRTLIAVCNNVSLDQDAALVGQRLVHQAHALCKLGIATGAPDDPGSLLAGAVEEARFGPLLVH